MSLRRFEGWEPRETTRHYYTRAGRLVRSVTTRDAEWTEQDQAWVLALAEYRASRCPSCGGDISECTDAATEGRWHVPPPLRCHASTAVSAARQTYADTPQAEALLFHADRRK